MMRSRKLRSIVVGLAAATVVTCAAAPLSASAAKGSHGTDDGGSITIVITAPGNSGPHAMAGIRW